MLELADFEKIVDRKIEFITTEALCRAWSDPKITKEATGHDSMAVRKALVLFSEYLISKDDLRRVEGFADAEGAAGFAEKFCSRGEQYCEKCLKCSARIKKTGFSGKSDAELFRTLEEFDEVSLRQLAFLWSTHPIARHLERKIREIVSEKSADAEQRDHMVAVLTYPEKENTPLVENRELMKIALKIQKHSANSFEGLPQEIKNRLAKHAAKFGFLGARGIGSSTWNKNDFFARAHEMAEDGNLEEKIRKSETEPKTNKAETEKIMAELDFSAEQKLLVEAAKEIVFFRTYRTEVMYHSYGDIEPLLAEIGKRNGYSLNQMKLMSTPEILGLTEKRVDGKTLAERNDFFGILMEGGKAKILDAESLGRLKAAFAAESKATSELKGTTACRGKATGKAKIAMTANDIWKVGEGDILVTSMTTPDFVPAMQRAAAIVTDEGGITCHAAIVARELGKPCIIGTRHATKTFKDGDAVEVDATKGTVRKI